jgi:DNA polymerase V
VKTLTLWLATDPFKAGPQYQNAVSVDLPVPTNHTPTLVRFARRAVEGLYRPGYAYKRVGVMFQELVPEDEVQGNLFWDAPAATEGKLMKVVDQVNAAWGAGTIRLAAEGWAHKWGTRFAKLSPKYTTRWSDLPVAKT